MDFLYILSLLREIVTFQLENPITEIYIFSLSHQNIQKHNESSLKNCSYPWMNYSKQD